MNLFDVQMYNLVFKVDDDPIQTVMLLWYEDCLDNVKGANAVPDSPDIGDFLWCIIYDVLLNNLCNRIWGILRHTWRKNPDIP